MSRKYDPDRHHRRSTRYKNWDYRTPGYYFITICTQNRRHYFEHPNLKAIAENRLQILPQKPWANNVIVDTSVIMPNHVHFILHIIRFWDPEQTEPIPQTGFHHAPTGSIGSIVGQYKSITTRAVNRVLQRTGQKVWQRGFWDRIVRNERELNATRRYIENNPIRWAEDRDNLDTLKARMTYHP